MNMQISHANPELDANDISADATVDKVLGMISQPEQHQNLMQTLKLRQLEAENSIL